MNAGGALAARRLVLTVAAVRRLAEACDCRPRLPRCVDSHPVSRNASLPVSAKGRADVHPALAASLRVLSEPEILLIVEAAYGSVEVCASMGLAGGLGAGVATAPGRDEVELSAFAPADLGAELARLVPGPRGAAGRSAASLPLAALAEVPLAARCEVPEVLDAVAQQARLHPRDIDLALHLAASLQGSLLLTVTGPGGWGMVTWLATGQGWLGLRLDSARGPEPFAELIPVTPGDLGAWLAVPLTSVIG